MTEAPERPMYGFHPAVFARKSPDKPAIIMAETGQVISFAELDRLSNQVAQLLRANGVGIGDKIAICLDNHPMYLVLAWGAQRAGTFMTTVPYRLTAPEIAYILEDSGAKTLFSSQKLGALMDDVATLTPGVRQFRFGGEGALDLDAALAGQPTSPIARAT